MGEYITPPSLPPDTYCRRLLIPNTPEWIGTVTGALMSLIYESSWTQTTGISQEDAANRAREMFNLYLDSGNDGECGDMNNCCPEPIILHRTNPDTGRPETSTDGGVTWTPDPNDTQFQIPLLPPPVTAGGTVTNCDAATNAWEHIKELIDATHDNLSAASTVFDLAVAVAEAALLLFIVLVTGGAASPLVIGFATAIWAAAAGVFALGITAYDAYWTADKRDRILCALVCNIGANGQFTEAQYQGFRSEIKAALPASPAFDIIMTSINAGGATGLSQMASYGNAAEADCASCECDNEWCYIFDFTTRSYSEYWSGITFDSNSAVANTHYIDGVGWQTANGNPNYSMIKIPSIYLNHLTRVTFAENGTDADFMGLLPSAGGDAIVNYGISDRYFDGSEPAFAYLGIGLRSRAIIINCTLHGKGANPFGEDNC